MTTSPCNDTSCCNLQCMELVEKHAKLEHENAKLKAELLYSYQATAIIIRAYGQQNVLSIEDFRAKLAGTASTFGVRIKPEGDDLIFSIHSESGPTITEDDLRAQEEFFEETIH